ncbi:MAG TPA: lysine 5,6-aminomutase subunit alpha [Candidatus Saccharimonadales bacterium]|nr:lysine 5,6-aminomutase subunit alpha [Candidatus Saccharimonadales bacterium]
MTSRSSALGPIDRLADRAESLAGAWGARARASTTVGQERAMLRLFGVTGLDRAGRPLAGAAVDRWLSSTRDGLGGGIALPFAMALLEYDLEPQHLALDVASGAVDLALEAELLREPDRRAVAEAEATRLAGIAIERIDADRTARRELQDLLGEARRPWLGTTLAEPDLDGALDEVVELAMAGFDLLRVEVPIGRELADRLHDAGVDVPEWHPRDRAGRAAGADLEEGDPAPTGSQRALARLRRVADGVAAERRGYVRLATAIPPLGVPEGAVVAAFERVDLVEADPMAEIVAGGIDPDRSLADHAFARRLHRRAETLISIGPGPLVVAPDLASGMPSDVATRSGRALAFQLIGVALARADGVPADRIVVGAYPAWLGDEAKPAARILAEIVLRHAVFPGHPIRFDEPPEHATGGTAAWPFLMAAGVARTGDRAIVMRHTAADARRSAGEARAGATVAADLAATSPPGPLEGLAADHARATVEAALTTLERLTDRGWRGLVGEGPSRGRRPALGGDAVAERTESFDPLAALG